MTKNFIALQQTLRAHGYDITALPAGNFGAVLAHAGVGKTALLVQMALIAMFAGKKVLHISLADPLKKVDLWYQEFFHRLRGQEDQDVGMLWEKILSHRFIMIFQADRLTVPKLEERLTELIEQKIFVPELVIMDGLHFDEGTRPLLQELKELAGRLGFPVWFTVHTHRYEEILPSGMTERFAKLAAPFSVIWQLQQEGDAVSITSLLASPKDRGKLLLDPSTLLINQRVEIL